MTDVNHTYAEEVGRCIGQTFNGLYRDRDTDLRAALDRWKRPDLAEHGFLMEQEGPAFGFQVKAKADGGVAASIDTRVLIGDSRLCGLDYDGPTDPHEYAEASLAGRLMGINYNRISDLYVGKVFRICLLHPEENRKLPPVSTVPTSRIVVGDD